MESAIEQKIQLNTGLEIESDQEDLIPADSYILLIDNRGMRKFIDLKMKGYGSSLSPPDNKGT